MITVRNHINRILYAERPTSTEYEKIQLQTKTFSFPDTWSTLTEALWNHLWGENARAAPSSGQTQRAADITEQFETLYSRAGAEAEENTRSTAMSVTMTTCSRCRKCGAMMFDEEIMAVSCTYITF